MNLNDYQGAALRTAIYPGMGSWTGLAYASLKLNGEAGELAEHVGKAMRDDALTETKELTRERRELIAKEIGDCLWYCAALASELGTTLDIIAEMNLTKLADRAARGKLSGSGDAR